MAIRLCESHQEQILAGRSAQRGDQEQILGGVPAAYSQGSGLPELLNPKGALMHPSMAFQGPSGTRLGEDGILKL